MLINQKFLSFHASNLPLLKSKCLSTSGTARGKYFKKLNKVLFQGVLTQINYSTGSTTVLNKSSHLSLNNSDYSVKLKNAAPTTTYMPATASNTEMSQFLQSWDEDKNKKITHSIKSLAISNGSTRVARELFFTEFKNNKPIYNYNLRANLQFNSIRASGALGASGASGIVASRYTYKNKEGIRSCSSTKKLNLINFKNNSIFFKTHLSYLSSFTSPIGDALPLNLEGYSNLELASEARSEERKPVFHLIAKPNFLTGYNFSQYNRFPKQVFNIVNQFSHIGQVEENVKNFYPIFSLPNPFITSQFSSLANTETKSKSGVKEMSDIYLSGYPKTSNGSNYLNIPLHPKAQAPSAKRRVWAGEGGKQKEIKEEKGNLPSAASGVETEEIPTSKKKRAGLKKEELEFNKLLTKKLTANFVDFFQKHDFYHKLNLLKDPYKNLQIKSYLRDNFILNLIFIQNFKEFKFFEKNFHLNLNLLPTTLTEFFDVFNVQNVKEQINNYLFFVYLINHILINLAELPQDSSSNQQLETSDSPSLDLPINFNSFARCANKDSFSSTGSATKTISDAIINQEPYFLNIFNKFKGLIEEDTRSYVKTIQNIKALQNLMRRAEKIENKIKREAIFSSLQNGRNAYSTLGSHFAREEPQALLKSKGEGDPLDLAAPPLNLEDYEKAYAEAFAKVYAEEKKEMNAKGNSNSPLRLVRHAVTEDGSTELKLEEEYKKLIDNIIYDLYDEFKYGESLGLINKVIFKNVKNLIFVKKKINRKRGINKFISTCLKNPYIKLGNKRFIQINKLYQDSNLNNYLFFKNLSFKDNSSYYPTSYFVNEVEAQRESAYEALKYNNIPFKNNLKYNLAATLSKFHYSRSALNNLSNINSYNINNASSRSAENNTNYNSNLYYNINVNSSNNYASSLSIGDLSTKKIKELNISSKKNILTPPSPAPTRLLALGAWVASLGTPASPLVWGRVREHHKDNKNLAEYTSFGSRSHNKERLSNSLNKWRLKYHSAILNKGSYSTKLSGSATSLMSPRGLNKIPSASGFGSSKNFSTFTVKYSQKEEVVAAPPLWGDGQQDNKINNVLNISKIQNNIIFEHYNNNSLHLYIDAINFLKKIDNYQAYGKSEWKEIILKKNLFLLSYKIKKDLREIIKSYALIPSIFVHKASSSDLENTAQILLLARSRKYGDFKASPSLKKKKEEIPSVLLFAPRPNGQGEDGATKLKEAFAPLAKELHRLYMNKINSLKLEYNLKSFSNIKTFDINIHNNLIKLYNQYFANPYIYNLYLISPYNETDIIAPSKTFAEGENFGKDSAHVGPSPEHLKLSGAKALINLEKAVKNPIFLNLLKTEKNLNLAVNSFLKGTLPKWKIYESTWPYTALRTAANQEKFKELTNNKLYSDLVSDYKALDSDFSYKNIFNLPLYLPRSAGWRTQAGNDLQRRSPSNMKLFDYNEGLAFRTAEGEENKNFCKFNSSAVLDSRTIALEKIEEITLSSDKDKVKELHAYVGEAIKSSYGLNPLSRPKGQKGNSTALGKQDHINVEASELDIYSDTYSVIVNNLLIQKLILSNFQYNNSVSTAYGSFTKIKEGGNLNKKILPLTSGTSDVTDTPLQGCEHQIENKKDLSVPYGLNLKRKTIINLHTEAVSTSFNTGSATNISNEKIANMGSATNLSNIANAANRGVNASRLLKNSLAIKNPSVKGVRKSAINNLKFINKVKESKVLTPAVLLNIINSKNLIPTPFTSATFPSRLTEINKKKINKNSITPQPHEGRSHKVRKLIPLLLKLRIHKDSYNKDKFDVKLRVKDVIKKKRIFNLKFRRNFNNLILKKLYLRNLVEKRIGLENSSKIFNNLLDPIDNIFDRRILRSKGNNRLAFVTLSNRFPSIYLPSSKSWNNLYKVVDKRNLIFYSNLHFLWSLLGDRRFNFYSKKVAVRLKHKSLPSPSTKGGGRHSRVIKLAPKGLKAFRTAAVNKNRRALTSTPRASRRWKKNFSKYYISLKRYKRWQLLINRFNYKSKYKSKYKAKGGATKGGATKGRATKSNKANNLVESYKNLPELFYPTRSPRASNNIGVRSNRLKLNYIKKIVLDLDSQYRYQLAKRLKVLLKSKNKGQIWTSYARLKKKIELLKKNFNNLPAFEKKKIIQRRLLNFSSANNTKIKLIKDKVVDQRLSARPKWDGDKVKTINYNYTSSNITANFNIKSPHSSLGAWWGGERVLVKKIDLGVHGAHKNLNNLMSRTDSTTPSTATTPSTPAVREKHQENDSTPSSPSVREKFPTLGDTTYWYKDKGDHIDTIKKWLLKQEEYRERSFMAPHLKICDTNLQSSKINDGLTVSSYLKSKGGATNSYTEKNNDSNSNFNSNSTLWELEGLSHISDPLNSLFNFEIDNKGINKYNKLGLRKIFSKFKFFRYFRYSGVYTGYKQIISYNFLKNDSRTNALNSFDHTGSLLKLSISVILKYFFKLMGLALISKPIFIFNHNKITIQISYYINQKVYFLNNNAKSSLLYLMIYNNNAMFGNGRSHLINNLYKIYNSMLGRPYSTSFYTDVKALNWKYLDDDWKYIYERRNIAKSDQSRYAYTNKGENYSQTATPRQKNTRSAGVAGKNLLNEFIYFTNPLYSDKVPFLDISNNLSKKKFLNLPLDLNYYSRTPIKNTLSNFYSEFNSLTYILETFFNCSIKLELNRLDDPYSESNIMAQLIGINGKDYTFEKIKNIFFPKFYYLNPNTLIKPFDFEPYTNTRFFSICSGIKIRVAGRFYLHRIVPKKTVSTIQLGSMARGVINLVEKSRYTNKSKRGSFSVTVWISHTY